MTVTIVQLEAVGIGANSATICDRRAARIEPILLAN
jgi:hypothetical protein